MTQFIVHSKSNSRCKAGVQILDDFEVTKFLLYGRKGDICSFIDVDDGSTLLVLCKSEVMPCECSKCACCTVLKTKFCKKVHCYVEPLPVAADSLLEEI